MSRFSQIEPPDTSSKAEPVAEVEDEPEVHGEPAPPQDVSKSPSKKYLAFRFLTNDRLKGSHRVVYATEFKAAGVKDQGDVTWGPLNNYRVPVESLSESARIRLLREPGFYEVEEA